MRDRAKKTVTKIIELALENSPFLKACVKAAQVNVKKNDPFSSLHPVNPPDEAEEVATKYRVESFKKKSLLN